MEWKSFKNFSNTYGKQNSSLQKRKKWCFMLICKEKKSFETSNPVVPKVLIYYIKYVLIYFKVNKGIKKCDTVYKNFLESFVFVIFHSAI